MGARCDLGGILKVSPDVHGDGITLKNPSVADNEDKVLTVEDTWQPDYLCSQGSSAMASHGTLRNKTDLTASFKQNSKTVQVWQKCGLNDHTGDSESLTHSLDQG